MRYIGNKTRLLSFIDEFIQKQAIEAETFCDIFSGTGSVGDYFKDKYTVIANDFLTSATALTQAKLLNAQKPTFKKFTAAKQAEPFAYFNDKKYTYQKHYFITNTYSPKGGRQFLSKVNTIKIDGIRLELEELYGEEILSEAEYYYLLGSLLESVTRFSNTSGTYEAFFKHWDSRALKAFFLSPIEMKETDSLHASNAIYSEDANELIRKIEGDILYIDPPYTVTEYSSAYHVLEAIARYDSPEVMGLTARRVANENKSNYTRKQQALLAFEDLIRQARFKNIVISYSTQSIISIKDMSTMLKKYAADDKVHMAYLDYRAYKNIRSSKKGSTLREVLIYIKKDPQFIKSPLNYSGSKDKLMPQIHRYLPEHISTFIDAMGGAFNVGANVIADTVVYNEYNPYVCEIVKLLLGSDKEKLVKYIEKTITQHRLEKGNSATYTAFRKHYNATRDVRDLFALTMFCFQNQMRFNSALEFNTPVGNCAYNDTLKDRILAFRTKAKNVKLLNLDFTELGLKDYDKDALFYFDPPYFITNATYNDGKRGFNGWDADQEVRLLEYIAGLHAKGYRFMLSNIIKHRDKTNHILEDWVMTHGFNIIELEHSVRKEVIITNYTLLKGKR